MDTKLNDGAVQITLDGQKTDLQPSIEAAIKIDRYFDGYQEAVRRVSGFRLADTSYVIHVGLGLPDKDFDVTQEKVFRSGVAELSARAILFITVLNNGGRMPEDQSRKNRKAA